MKKRVASLLLALTFSSSMLLMGCEDEDILGQMDLTDVSEDYESGDTVTETSEKASSDRNINMNLEESGSLSITRNCGNMALGSPMGEEGTWTIFVYLCGSDLESENGMATMDIEEMMDASISEGIQFVIQTGGANSWENGIDEDSLGRYVITDGEIYEADSQSLASMADPSTLADFITWGVENYAAYNMGLVFWNHGGGSISGVCFDELDDYDSLSLSEINEALSSVCNDMTDKFEFIGFDACLMATLETANIMATYADYMVASEETEPGYGWDYTAIGDYLADYPTADGAALGRVIVDSFYKSCAQIDQEDGATLSVIDLNRIDDLLIAFNDFSNKLYDYSQDTSNLAKYVRYCAEADNFGGNNKAEGYTNMIDLKGFINALNIQGGEAVINALDNAVIYNVNGNDHLYAGGISMYYPLSIQGSTELSTFRQIATSPYYLSFVNLVAYGASDEVDISDAEEDFDNWDYSGDYDDEDYSFYDDVEIDGNSAYITFDEAPYLSEDGAYTFVLDNDGINNATMIEAYVYQLSEDGEDYISLGISADVFVDWETGVVSDLFDGYWFSLPDGQNLCIYIVNETDDFGVYTSPILLNGEETNLRLTIDYSTYEISIDGTWDGIDENGMASRDVYRLSAGDVITPLYDAFSLSNPDEEFYYQGSDYILKANDVISYGLMDEGDYAYGFYIDDAFGNYYTTDFVTFAVEDGKVYFYEE